MLLELLKSDLQRQYDFEGQPERKPTIVGILKRCFHPRYSPVVLYRLSFFLNELGLVPIAKLVSLINFIFFGIEIALRCSIGKGLYFPHTVGTVIGALEIGSNAVIYHGVTLGAKEINTNYSEQSRPRVGDNVFIGSGAKIMGGITIGNNVIIGANAVVTKSLPDNVKAVGIPARVIT